MLLTEDEARTKACVQTLCADIWSDPKNNDGDARTAITPCIASECMAWRWLDPDGWSGTPEDQRKGYCGLAGKVEP